MSGPLDFDDEPRRETPGASAPPPPEPARPVGTGRWTSVIGLVALLAVVLVTLNAVGGAEIDPGGPQPGDRLTPFAVPLAGAAPRADGNEDANLLRDKACSVRGPGVLNICQVAERGPVALALFVSPAEECRTALLAQLDRVAPRAPDGVQIVAVGARGDRALLAGRHPYPIGWDRDGGLASAYGVVGCPQITFAEQGGRVVDTTRDVLDDAELLRRLQELAR